MATDTLTRPATLAVDGTETTPHPAPLMAGLNQLFVHQHAAKRGTCDCTCSTCDNTAYHCGRAYSGCKM